MAASTKTDTIIILSVILFSWADNLDDGDRDTSKPSHDHHSMYTNSQETGKQCDKGEESCSPNQNIYKPIKLCWGYEDDCSRENYFSYPHCHGDNPRDVEKKQLDFFHRVDFGSVKDKRENMLPICKPAPHHASSLECSKDLHFCRAKNLFIDFRNIEFNTRSSFDKNFFKPGEIGGNCDVDSELLARQGNMEVDLWSWFSELKTFSSVDLLPLSSHCDEIVVKPTFFVKQDFAGNMYHHFCDFINFYTSQHVNGSDLSTDVDFINWDTNGGPYRDPLFGVTWRAFTRNILRHLEHFSGKRVCFQDVVFSMPPRNPFGLYYNAHFPNGCGGSGLVKAFSKHILHRLNIVSNEYSNDRIRVTFLLRKTNFRQVMNHKGLIKRLQQIDGLEVREVVFNRDVSFEKQLQISSSSDIFIGMHGAGLTHFLFLPDWAVAFELYNCEDVGCYRDLAALRGLKYLTWEDNSKFKVPSKDGDPRYRDQPKFWNFEFEVEEFLKIANKAIDHVKTHRP